MNKSWKATSVFAVLVFLAGSSARAQSTFGAVRGSTLDQSGAALPGAEITLHSLDENTNAVATSDGSGNFSFENLKPGHYSIRAAKEGFTGAIVNQLELTARQTLRVDVSLSVAAQTQIVEVAATAAVVNTENATLSDSRENSDITQLPINSRSVSSSPLAALAVSPEVTRDSQGNIRGRRRDLGADRFFGGWNFDRQRAFQRRAAGRLPFHGKHRRDENNGLQQQRRICPDRRRDLHH